MWVMFIPLSSSIFILQLPITLYHEHICFIIWWSRRLCKNVISLCMQDIQHDNRTCYRKFIYHPNLRSSHTHTHTLWTLQIILSAFLYLTLKFIYADEGDNTSALPENERYCYCMRENDSREVSGRGWWKATSHVKKIYATNNNGSCADVIGYKRPLTFHKFKDTRRNRSNAIKTNWIMHEYTLHSLSTVCLLICTDLLFPILLSSFLVLFFWGRTNTFISFTNYFFHLSLYKMLVVHFIRIVKLLKYKFDILTYKLII